ncbi:acyl-CoA synthetase (AMP-forming)/AMP-acid ligase II [Thioflavicoccus mobilis 8321]|uniref:Acyl-CoA synthetase (AMP-forming)/AMP-acid ligase II n=1 Tax=Thioflavicoccus mobilis 8321 TaxID=765912 RepID=L0GRA4_9GAMM|nr:long-chain fatty acid--CoA ligase [Thioflavicoccus mobilis]AGA89288.1 acyl-CoA synthetase (AMP-forming)/AMP-acid ligase II [Thioflavicoccus mobilis 8321]
MSSSSDGAAGGIPEAFRVAARRGADAPCIVGDFPVWTFARLDRASDRVAAGLAAGGIAHGERVGLLCPNGPEFAVLYLGILKAGAIVVPLNLRLSPKELAFILADAGAAAFCWAEELADLAEHSALAALEVPVRVRIAATVAGGGSLLTGLPDVPGEPPERSCAPQDAAAILYTSGTTGRPKGAVLTHGNLVSNARAVALALGLRTGEDRILVVLPMFHAFAATVGMLAPLLHGAALVPLPRFEPVLVSDTIATHGATVFLGVPSMYHLLLRAAEQAAGQWRSVRFCVSGGAALPQALLRAFEARFGVPVLEGDGPTECSPVTCVNPVAGVRKPGSVGLPLPGVEMSIRDPAGAPLPVGEFGEVCVRGPNVMRGYWRLPEATREAFFDDWFRTGDLGYRDEDGYFYLVDRLKDMIITNGANVYPRMIEEVLYRHPAILEAAVVGEPHRLHGEVPVAHVVAPGADLREADLRAWCRDSLGAYEVPRRFVFCETLPKNAAGKILKRELRRGGEVERGVDLPTGP